METPGHQEVKHQVCEIFENWAEHYATEREQLPYFRAQLEIVFKMLAGKSGRVLDIGCAGGAEIVGLRARGFSVVGVDLAPRMLQFAQRRFERDREVYFCQADIDQLPFSSESMNHVICLGVLEFVPDYGTALAGICRVLRPSGTAVFAIPTATSLYLLGQRFASLFLRPPWRIAKRLLGRPSTPPDASVRRNLCVPWRYRALLKQHGLEPLQSKYSNYFLYPLDRLPNLNVKVADLLEPVASVPLLRCGASVYLVSARKR